MSVRRLVAGTIKIDSKRTSQGFLRCDAVIARTGIQLYAQPDGTVRREYRPPDEVFSTDAMASAAQAPITYTPDTPNMHPPEKVTAKNARKYAVGWTGTEVKKDGHLVTTSATVFDEDAIAAAESGKASGVSCGYECTLDFTPGSSPEGEKYDAVQRQIRINHVAMVRPEIARAGAEARLRLDANDDEVPAGLPGDDTPSKGSEHMGVKIRIDGIECEVSETAAALLAKQEQDRAEKKKKREQEKTDADKAHVDALAGKDKEIDTLKAEGDKQKARADVAEAAKAVAEKARADAEDPKKRTAVIAARVALESKARAILGDDAKLSEKTDAEIKHDVAAKAYEDIKLDGKSEAYVEALFDQAVAEHDKTHPMDDVRRTLEDKKNREDAGGGEGEEDEPLTADAAYAEMRKANRAASQPKAAKK